MLTHDQLAQLKELNAKLVCYTESEKMLQEVVTALAAEITRLQTALTTKDSVLGQFANSANWLTVYVDHGYGYEWVRGDSPVMLASQALSKGKE